MTSNELAKNICEWVKKNVPKDEWEKFGVTPAVKGGEGNA